MLRLFLTSFVASVLACGEAPPLKSTTEAEIPHVEIVRRLSTAQRIASVGQFDGKPEETLGARVFLAVQDTNVLVADQQFSRVSRYGVDGSFRGSVGRPGGGVGEFRAVTGIAVTGTDSVIISDGAGYITYIDTSNNNLQITDQRAIGLSPRSVCKTSAGMLVTGYEAKNRRSIHLMSSDHRVLQSLRPVTGNSGALRRLQSTVRIACDKDGKRVAVGQPGDTIITIYDLNTSQDGVRFPLPNLQPIQFKLHPDGALEQFVMDGAAGYDQIESLVTIGGGAFLVQTVFFTVNGMNVTADRVRSFVIDDGGVVELEPQLPLIKALGGSHFLTFTDDPFPRVDIYRY